MEYHLTKKTIPGLHYALDTAVEQPVDVELTLPDYCPDIERILSCTLAPKIYMANVSGDRLNVEGAACVRVLYLDGDRKCLRTYEHAAPFSESLPLKGDPADCAVFVDAKPEYLNCRALSPRKLSLHGAFSLRVKAADIAEQEYFSYEDGGDLQVKGERIAASALCGLCSDSFSMQEDIPVSGKSEIAALLGHRLSARLTELKAIHNKIMFSAELKLELMYLADIESGEVECMSYSLPVSRVADCEGAEENAVIDGELSVMSYDIRLSDDALGGSSLLSLDAKLCFSALCYADREIVVLTDAFSTEKETQVRIMPFSCCAGTVCRTYTDVGKANVSVEEEIGRVLDVHCERLQTSYSTNDDTVMFHVKMKVCILYITSDGEKRYVERDADFSYCPDTEGCDTIERLRASVESLSYRLADSRTLELRAELCYRMTMCRRLSCPAVTAVSADDDAPDRERDGALILYYTDAGDSVWDISKRFSSRPGDVIAENGLEDDSVSGGMMLLIPTA